MFPLSGLIWFVVTLLPLAILQRVLHREIQSVFLLLTRSRALTVALFSILFLPGVMLHELSHYLAAVVLQVRAARFSLLPHVLPDGRLQLGYVETARSDAFRDSLIGAAPLFIGGAAVGLIATTRFNLLPLLEQIRSGNLAAIWLQVQSLPHAPDFPFWFYLLFAISSTMLPSDSDRHAWLPVGVALAVMLAVAAVAGAGPWMLDRVAPIVNSFLNASAAVFGLSAAVHLALVVPLGLLQWLLSKVTGLQVA